MRRLTTAVVVAVVLAAPVLGAAPTVAGATAAGDAAGEWAVELSASADWASDTVVLGAAPDATDALDSDWDSPATPPAPDSHLSLYEVDTDASGDFRNLNVSYIDHGEKMVWEFELDYQTAEGSADAATLSWTPDAFASVPAVDDTKHDVTLVVGDREIDMRNTSTATVALSDSSGTKSFTIVADATAADDGNDNDGNDNDGNDNDGNPGGGGNNGNNGGSATTTTQQPTTTKQPTTTQQPTTTDPSTTQPTTTDPTTTESTPTDTTSTAQTTAESTTEQSTQNTDQSGESGGTTPGFTSLTAVVAVIGAVVLATRQSE